MNIQGSFPLGLTGCISLLSKELSMGAPQCESINSSVLSFLYGPTLTCVMYMTTGKTIALTKRTFVGKVMFLLLILSAFVTAFLPRSKSLLILWLQSPSTVILEPKKIKSVTASSFPPSICKEVMGPDAMILVFWMLSFKSAFSLSSSPSSRGSLVPLHFLSLWWWYIHIWGCWYFSWESWFPASDSSSWVFHMMYAAYWEKAMAPHSSTLAWKIPWMEEPGGLQSMGLLRVGHDWAISLSLFTFMHWRWKWQPTLVFLPGESQRQGSLVGCHLWGRTESDMTEVT